MGSEVVAPKSSISSPTPKKKKQLWRIRLYFNESDLTTIASDAEGAGFRRVGLPPLTLKPHGFAHERVGNTDGIARYLRSCWRFVKANQADYERLKRKEQLQAELERLDEDKRRGLDGTNR